MVIETAKRTNQPRFSLIPQTHTSQFLHPGQYRRALRKVQLINLRNRCAAVTHEADHSWKDVRSKNWSDAIKMQIWQRTVQSAGAVSIILLGVIGFENLYFERLSAFRTAGASSREPGSRSTHLMWFAARAHSRFQIPSSAPVTTRMMALSC